MVYWHLYFYPNDVLFLPKAVSPSVLPTCKWQTLHPAAQKQHLGFLFPLPSHSIHQPILSTLSQILIQCSSLQLCCHHTAHGIISSYLHSYNAAYQVSHLRTCPSRPKLVSPTAAKIIFKNCKSYHVTPLPIQNSPKTLLLYLRRNHTSLAYKALAYVVSNLPHRFLSHSPCPWLSLHQSSKNWSLPQGFCTSHFCMAVS